MNVMQIEAASYQMFTQLSTHGTIENDKHSGKHKKHHADTQIADLRSHHKPHHSKHVRNNNAEDAKNSELTYKASASSFSLSFNGSQEESGRVLFASISQKLESFEFKSNENSFSASYSSNYSHVSFGSFEDAANSIVSHVQQVVSHFFASSSENTDHTPAAQMDDGDNAVINSQPVEAPIQSVEAPPTPITAAPAEEVIAVEPKEESKPSPINQAPVETIISSKPPKDITPVRTAINDGFEESKNAIQQQGAFTSDLSKAFNKLQNRLDKLLDKLAKLETSTSAQYQEFSQSSDTSIQIKTKDGDLVNINVSKNSHENYFSGSVIDNMFAANAHSYNSINSSELTYSVQGELDEDELDAIDKLVAGIRDSVHKFNKDDMESALASVKNIEFNNEELEAFSFSSKTTTELKAVNLYQQLNSNPDTDSQQAVNSELPVSPATETVLDLVNQAKTTSIAEPESTVSLLAESFYKQLEVSIKEDSSSVSYSEKAAIQAFNFVA